VTVAHLVVTAATVVAMATAIVHPAQNRRLNPWHVHFSAVANLARFRVRTLR